MAISDINEKIRIENGDGYETLRKAITNSGIAKINRRDAVFLLNKQFEGISETKGNLFIYMFYFSCTDPAGKNAANSPTWYKIVIEDDTELRESTPWCACYVSFVLNLAGITSKGHWSSIFSRGGEYIGLTKNTSFETAKSMDTVHFLRKGGGHVGFLCKEDKNIKNNYNESIFVLGGNQGDKVSLNPGSFYRDPVAFGTLPSSVNDNISSGDFFSVLSYFKNCYKQTSQERINELKARTDENFIIKNQASEEVRRIRALISETNQNSLYVKDKNLRDRLKELIIFENSIIDGNLMVTGNISQSQKASSKKVT
jgi:hypothetical protein